MIEKLFERLGRLEEKVDGVEDKLNTILKIQEKQIDCKVDKDEFSLFKRISFGFKAVIIGILGYIIFGK